MRVICRLTTPSAECTLEGSKFMLVQHDLIIVRKTGLEMEISPYVNELLYPIWSIAYLLNANTLAKPYACETQMVLLSQFSRQPETIEKVTDGRSKAR